MANSPENQICNGEQAILKSSKTSKSLIARSWARISQRKLKKQQPFSDNGIIRPEELTYITSTIKNGSIKNNVTTTNILNKNNETNNLNSYCSMKQESINFDNLKEEINGKK